MHTEHLLNERVFLNKWIYDDAEKAYYCKTGVSACSTTVTTSSITDEVTRLRQQLQNQLGNVDASSINDNDLVNRLSKLELENSDLKKQLKSLETRILQLESGDKSGKPAAPAAAQAKPAAAPAKAAPAPAKKEESKEDDDDFELFGDDDEESEEKKRVTEERLKAYNDKKANKPQLIAKSSIIMDVKPWDDETDMKKLEESVKSIEMDGLLWGTSKLVPIAYGIKKLQITCVIEDDKVSTELLEEKICEFEDYVQSVDIVSFNKI